MAGASVSQSGANVVLRGAASILRKRSILRNDSASTVVTTELRSRSVRCLVRRTGGSGHRGGFKYAAHTPAAVCGWRLEQN